MNEDPSICVECGLCCDGALYEHAKVAPGEEKRMVAAGLDLFDVGSHRMFRQPCPQSNCGRCMIYETRFEICHSFECKLLKTLKAGECSFAEAQAKIAEAKQLLGKAVAADPQARSAAGRKVIRKNLADAVADPACRNSGNSASRLLAIVAVDTFLKRWFRLAHEQQSEDSASVNGPSRPDSGSP